MSMIKVSDLKVDDLVDLEGDKYADPKRKQTSLQFEFAEVHFIEQETPNCICVYFDFDAVGFPPDHLVRRENA